MPAKPPIRHFVTFGRALRAAGLEVGPRRIADAICALEAVNLAQQEDVYWALRTTLVSRFEELEIFDSAFAAWFLRVAVRPVLRPVPTVPPPYGRLGRTPAPAGGTEVDGGEREVGSYSTEELLRHKDFSKMTREEFEQTRRWIAAAAITRPRRRSRRLRADRRGRSLHLRGLVRASLASGGDPIRCAYRGPAYKPRKLVLILDVSGSMEAYSRALLLFLHATLSSGRGVETFVFGTHLTRLTAELATRDPETALSAAALKVNDWSGGTRIGDSLKAYNDEWGRRALTRGSVTVIMSDGLERGDDEPVDREMARLARQAFAVVWVNPLKGDPRYEATAAGMRAALPHVDRLIAGHNVASLERLATVLEGISRRHAA